MAGKNKFGAFGGVFTPSILTILGVIMYMRLGWVVGNAGLIGTIIIILIAHVISVSTGLSVSSVATDKKVGAGGIYYILSRSMGIPIGGSIGITLYIGTAFSIALYLIGFAESFNGYFGLDTSINGLRISGTLGLIALTAIALISTSVALKTQFFILAAIVISLISIFFGTSEFVPEKIIMFSGEDAIPMETIFAIFFPAVTGFTAGIAMSGDLKDPKKSIPVGTIAAVGVGLVVYIGLAVFIASAINTETLKSDYNILMKISLFAPAVVAGIWGATLSSALGGILGGPRILQAMSLDKVTPAFFGKGRGKDNEPVNALIFVFIIAQAGILIGELDVIARVVSMFYLAAYGFINLSFFLESWANPDFQPTFKVKRWIGFVGSVACFGVMFKLDMMAMFGSFIVIGGLYFWLQRKQIQLQSGDVWQSVWNNVVNKGLKKLEKKEESNPNWNPNIILFSGQSTARRQLLEFSKMLSGRTGLVTDFNLTTNENGHTNQAKTKQSVQEELLDELGIFGRRIEVDEYYSGIESVATTFGFSGIDPNTVMMGWERNVNDPEKYAKMTEKLIHLDYNLLYLDYDKKAQFGKQQSIDIWWRETDGNNAELMLNITRFVLQSPEWAKARVRILFVNHNNVENNIVKSKISNLVNKLRIDAEIKIINNGVEQKSFYEIIELQSSKTDLILIGIPNIEADKQAEFILHTDELFETIGTTLLIKASNNFNVLDLNVRQENKLEKLENTVLRELPISKNIAVNELVRGFDTHLSESLNYLSDPGFTAIGANYLQFILSAKRKFKETLVKIQRRNSTQRIIPEIQNYLNNLIYNSEEFQANNLPMIRELLDKGIRSILTDRRDFLEKAPAKVWLGKMDKTSGKEGVIKWKAAINSYSQTRILPNTLRAFYAFGVQNFVLLNKLTERISGETQLFVEKVSAGKEDEKKSLLSLFSNSIRIFEDLEKECSLLEKYAVDAMRSFERDICIELKEGLEKPAFNQIIRHQNKKIKRKVLAGLEASISDFATDWHRNQTLAHQQVESGINLSIVGLSVFRINEKIRFQLKDTILSRQKKELESLSEAVNYVRMNYGQKGMEEFDSEMIDRLSEEVSQVDFNALLKSDEDKLLVISTSAKDQVELVSADSYNNLADCQNADLEEVSVNLANIQSYIIQSSYLSPLQNSIQKLSEVFNENAEELYNSSNLIKHILKEEISEENRPLFLENIEEVQIKVHACQENLTKASLTFTQDLNSGILTTISDLNIRTIIESIELYSKVSHNPVIKTKFQEWYDARISNLSKVYGDVLSFIVQRKQDIDTIKFSEKHQQYLNNIERANNFLKSFSIDSEVIKKLSFYYVKLFTGSHLGSLNPMYRQKELAAARTAIQRMNNGVSGAIMILGPSQSGKSYFTETIANTLLKGEKTYINPGIRQNYEVNDLHLAFQKAFSKSGTTESILNQIENKSILIFENIESWWLKAENGSAAINHLAKMIEKFGSKHYFILSCNIHSFDIIRKSSVLERQLLSTLIISPSSKAELKEIILNRHRTAGSDLWYKDKELEEAKGLDALFSDIHNKSNGNVGIALQDWIQNIRKAKEGHLVIQKAKAIHFPDIHNPEWKVILYQFLIHGNMKEAQLRKLFAEKEHEWVFSTIREMEKAGLLYRKYNKTIELHSSSGHYIENWLRDLKIIN